METKEKQPIPNTMIAEDGTVIFIYQQAIPQAERDRIALAETHVERIEMRYGTDNPTEMIRKGASKREVITYIDAKGYLMRDWGIGL